MDTPKSVVVAMDVSQETLDRVLPELLYYCHAFRQVVTLPGQTLQQNSDFQFLSREQIAGQPFDFLVQDLTSSPEPVPDGALSLYRRGEPQTSNQLVGIFDLECGGRFQGLKLFTPMRALWGEGRARPWCSIAITAYNYGRFLAQAINSVLEQSDDQLELFVLDNASTDNTTEVLSAYANNPRVIVLQHERNHGAIPSALAGYHLSRGEYFGFLCADDYLLPGYLDEVRRLLASCQPLPDLIFSRINYVNAECQPMNVPPHPGYPAQGGLTQRNELLTLLVKDCYTPPSSTLYRRAVLDRLGWILGDYHGAGDWAQAGYLALHGYHFAFVDRPAVSYRVHSAQHTVSWSSGTFPLEDHTTLLERVLGEGVPAQLLGHEKEVAESYLQRLLSCQVPISDDLRARCRKVFEALGQASLLPASDRSPVAGPLFSVVLTTYNRPRLLQDALASVFEQTCQDFEVLLVNDGGDLVESLLDWIKRDSRITYVRQPNRGLSSARNTALKLARGRFIVYLDDDDLMRRKHLEVLKNQFQLTPAAVVYTDADMVFEKLEGGLRQEQKRANPYLHGEYDKLQLQISNYIPVNTFSHARQWLDKTGLFDESLTALEDWDLLIRLSRLTEFVHIRKTTVEVRQRVTKTDHMVAREHGRMRALFERIYTRYDDLSSVRVRAGRAAVLAANHPSEARMISVGYQQWLDSHALREVDGEVLATRMCQRWHKQPLLTLLMKVAHKDLDALGVTIDSLQQQFYQHWRLVIVADFPAPSPIFTSTELLGWVEVASLDDVELSTQALNDVVTDWPGDWVALIPPGTELTPDCLLRTADAVEGKTQLVALYSDHDCQQLPGCYDEPQFKPDFNLEYLLSWDYIGAACWFNQQSIMNVGGFAAFPEMEGYELLLRLVDAYSEDAVGHLAFPLMHLPRVESSHLSRASRRVAIENHLQRLERPGEVLAGALPDIYKLIYPLQGEPLVSIIIPNRDKMEFLQPCIETLLGKTSYQNFEILIVDNQSEDPDVLAFYQGLQETLPKQVRVLSYDAPFNFSAQCNLGAREARGEYLLLLNNDIEVVQPEWLERMLMQAQRPEVGVVGAKLVYPETGMVQNGGIVLGNGNTLLAVANHYGMDCKLDDPGYMNRMQCDMYLSAVTAACMMVRREVYQQVDGFTEELGVLFNDVEFCLKVGQQGLNLLWTPYSVLVHHHGMSVNSLLSDPIAQGRLAERSRQEHNYMFAHWMPQLARDPAYNRNLTLQGNPLAIEQAIPCSWDPDFTERPKILAAAIPGGSGEYRLLQPLVALSKAGLAQTCCLRPEHGPRLLKPLEIERMQPDVLVLQNAMTDSSLECLKLLREYFPDLLKIFTLDDLLTNLPEKSSFYRHIKSNYRDVRRRLRTGLANVDRLIVSTEPLAEFASEFIGNIHIVPNRLAKASWLDLPSLRRAGAKPRVGWVGAQQHRGDLEVLHEVIRATAHEVDWIFMGMWPEGLDDYIKEKHNGVRFSEYPKAVARLNLDLAVAPLEINAFNESKSNLRLLEYGAMRWPVVCSDILPYQTNEAPVKRVANTTKAWVDAILERVHDLDAAYREGDALRAWVERDYLLEDHLDEWMLAYSRY